MPGPEVGLCCLGISHQCSKALRGGDGASVGGGDGVSEVQGSGSEGAGGAAGAAAGGGWLGLA